MARRSLGPSLVLGMPVWLGLAACTRERAPEPGIAAEAIADPSPAVASASPSKAPEPVATSPTPRSIPSPPAVSMPAFDPATPPRWIAAASGAVPELNQVSIEQDIALAATVLGPGGRVLFGSGPDTPTVQVLADDPATAAATPDPVLLALGDLFDPRGGRGLRYRPTTLRTAEPATADGVLAALDHALAGGPDPLLLYLGGHGEIGEQPRLNTISMWGDSAFDVTEVAEHLDRSPRPVRLVVTTCYSGGFGELVFDGADEARGAATTERCGLFSAPWDLEATGCDPDPDRAKQQGYGLHFLHALQGRDREGRPLPRATLDLDGDGRISLLEAHTRVRIASTAADVPTSTSERWLRHAAPERGAERAVTLPEEEAVIESLAARLGLQGREASAYLELQRLGDDLEVVGRQLERAQRQEDQAYRATSAELLARWPVLDDPWHPDQAELLRTQHDAIAEQLERSPQYAAYVAARGEVDRLSRRSWALRQQAAPYERLTRALDNRRLAARLRAVGGDGWATFERILACERGVP